MPETRKAPKELLELAALGLKERRLLQELVSVRQEKWDLQDRIRALGIEVPWMKNR